MRRGKILIVEDELIARENLDHVLKKEGYDTVAVESGVLAFKALEKQEFDLVMTDLKMQQVDGLQVLERTKELSPDTEVIMITGFATVSTAVEAMQKGAYHSRRGARTDDPSADRNARQPGACGQNARHHARHAAQTH